MCLSVCLCLSVFLSISLSALQAQASNTSHISRSVESVKDDKMPGEELEPRRRRSGQFISSALQAQASGSHVSRPPVLSAIGVFVCLSFSAFLCLYLSLYLSVLQAQASYTSHASRPPVLSAIGAFVCPSVFLSFSVCVSLSLSFFLCLSLSVSLCLSICQSCKPKPVTQAMFLGLLFLVI